MAGARIVRLFVSSPGDVVAEGLRVKLVAERLNGLFPDNVRFETLRWDDKSADKSFQPQFPETIDCDIVVGIFAARTGSEPSPTVPRVPDDEAIPSGIAYATSDKLPDIYVFQQQAPTSNDETDRGVFDLQWKLLNNFAERRLRTRGGRFHTEFNSFTTTDDFECQLERMLRDWIAKNVMAGRDGVRTPENPALVSASGNPGRKRHLVTAIAAIAAVIFALVAAAAVNSLRLSQQALTDAKSTISELVEATSETGQSSAQPEKFEALLEKARTAINTIAGSSSDPRIVQPRARTNLILAEIDLDRGRVDRASEYALAAFEIIEPSAKAGNKEARHLRAQAERLIGATHWERSNNEEAKRHYERGIADLSELLKLESDPKITSRWMRSLADLYQLLGDVLLYRLGRPNEAQDAFERSRVLRVGVMDLGHLSPAYEHDLAWITNKRGDVESRLGNDETALKWFVEARDRLVDLKDRIWDNPQWATNLSTIYSNIGMLKRRQNRFAEAAPQFAQAEEILAAVYRRDPKSLDRSSALNWCRFIRTENLFRWALAKNDRILMLEVREQAISIIEMAASIIKQAPQRKQEQFNKIREEAFRAAIDATLRQWNGNNESAAAGFIEAADIIAKDYMPIASTMPWRELLAENIQYLEWAGMAYAKAQRTPEAQALFKRALNMLVEYRGVLGEKVFEDFRPRIAARLERSPPAVERTPVAVERAPPPPAERAPAAPAERVPAPAESAPPASDRAPPAADRPPSAADTVSPPQQ